MYVPRLFWNTSLIGVGVGGYSGTSVDVQSSTRTELQLHIGKMQWDNFDTIANNTHSSVIIQP